MEYTGGLGKPAEVWLDGRLLSVCDGVSAPDGPCAAGLLGRVCFQYVAIDGLSWEAAARGNPDKKKGLEPVRGWSYAGYGQVTQIMPVRIDFGLLEMDDANWTYDETLVGRFVQIPIDRLEIVRAEVPDWPEGM